MYQRPSEPLSVGGVINSGLRLFRESLPQVFLPALIGGLLSTLPEAYTLLRGLGSVESALLGDSAGMVIGVAVIGQLLSVVAYLTVLAMIDAIANNRAVALNEALLLGLTRLPAIIGASILYGIAVGLGTLLLIVPGIIISVYWALYMIAIITDRKGPIESLGSSYGMIKGYWWRTATILSVPGIIFIVVYAVLAVFVIGEVLGGSGISDGSPTLLVVNFVATPLTTAILAPLSCAILLATCYDLRLRVQASVSA